MVGREVGRSHAPSSHYVEGAHSPRPAGPGMVRLRQAAIRNSGQECRALDGIRFSRHGTRCSRRKRKKRARLTRACRRSTPHLLVLVLWPNCEYSSASCPLPPSSYGPISTRRTPHTLNNTQHTAARAIRPPSRSCCHPVDAVQAPSHTLLVALPTPTNSGCPLSLFSPVRPALVHYAPSVAGPPCSV